MAPEWLLGYMLVISTFASAIASQAMISGIYSLTRQAVQLGYVPRMAIIHTSSREIGQIYIPFVNYLLLICVVWLVLSFKTSSALASAYGIAVSATMLITTALFIEVARSKWKWNLWKLIPFALVFFTVDLAFFMPNLAKLSHGGWITVAIGVVIFLLMSTWKEGRKILAEVLKAKSIDLRDFIKRIEEKPPHRVEGSAIFMSSDTWGVPIPLLHNLKHNKVLHETVGILTIRTKEVPHVPKKDRLELEKAGPGIYRIIAYYGFMETPKIKHILEACREKGINFTLSDTTFVLGRETILPTRLGGMALWREWLFAIMSRNAERPTAFFKIPPNQVIEVGIRVEI
jgi:KUP system potassium uptake protein